MKKTKKIYFLLFCFLFGLRQALLMDGYKFVENQIKFNTRKLIITKNVYNNLKR